MSLVTFAPTEAMQVTLRPRVYKVDIGKVGFTGPTGPQGNAGTSTAPSYTKAAMLALGSPTAGDIVRVTDDIRGLWTYTGTQWKSITGWADVTDFGAKGDGVTDDGAAVRAAAAAAAGKTLYFPPGTYLMGLAVHPHPDASTTYAMFFVPSQTTVKGAGRDATIIKLANSTTKPVGATLTYLISNQFGGDKSITFEDFTLDGNASNQSGQTMQHQGLVVVSCSGARHHRVKVLNVHGLGYAPDAPTAGDIEVMFFSSNSCSDVSYVDCQAVANAGSSSSGFSANSSVGVEYVDCWATGMTVGLGFTHNNCRGIGHVNCHAYDNALSGFNAELAEESLYVMCFGGGRSSAGTSNPYSPNEVLGNGWGFIIHGCTGYKLLGCSARYNTNYGAYIRSTSSGQVIACSLTNNTGGTLLVEGGSTAIVEAHLSVAQAWSAVQTFNAGAVAAAFAARADSGNPLTVYNAAGTLAKFIVDSSGNVTLGFDAAFGDTRTLTLSGRGRIGYVAGLVQIDDNNTNKPITLANNNGTALTERVRLTSGAAAAALQLTTTDVAVMTAGRGLKIKEGSNATMGVATLVAGSVVVSTTAVTATSRIQLTSQVDGGTPGFLRVSTRTAGTSFTITSSSGSDTSTVAWFIVEPA